MPAPGWTGEYDWTGFIPFSALPSAVNPASGHFVSANNKIVPDTYPYFLSRDWDLPNRAERIEALLAATPVQTPETSAAIQADTLSLMAQRLVPLMTRLVEKNGTTQQATDLLAHWDFHMDRAKAEPLLFTAWLREFSRAVLFGRFGNAIADYWDLRPRVMELVLTERPDWCDDPKRPGEESCGTRLAKALEAALTELRRAYGEDMRNWQWGRAHVAVFANPVFSRIPVLRDWLEASIPTAGSYDTLNRGPSTIRDDAHPFEQRFGAGLRTIADMASLADARMIMTPGQSGNPLSAHFADLLRPWRDFDRLSRPWFWFPRDDRASRSHRSRPVCCRGDRRGHQAHAGDNSVGIVRIHRRRALFEARNSAPYRILQGARCIEQVADARSRRTARRRRGDVRR